MDIEIRSTQMSEEEMKKWNEIREGTCPHCGQPLSNGKVYLVSKGEDKKAVHKRCFRAFCTYWRYGDLAH